MRFMYAIPILTTILLGCGSNAKKQQFEENYNRIRLSGDGAKESGDHEKALSEYSKLIEMNPNRMGGYWSRGTVYAEMKQYDNAIADFTRAIELDDKHGSLYVRRGQTLEEIGQIDRAFGDYSSAIRVESSNWIAYSRRGAISIERGDYDKAIDDYTQSLSSYSENSYAHRMRGIAWYRKKSWAKAREDFDTAITLQTDDELVENHLAAATLLATCPDNSIRDGKRAVELTLGVVKVSDTHESRACLAAAYAEIADFPKAIAEQRKVLNDMKLPDALRSDMESRLELLLKGQAFIVE